MKIDLEIMDLFKELEEVIENAPLKGLARKSISLDKEEVLAIISDIKALMPEEVNQAIWINRERQRIIKFLIKLETNHQLQRNRI